MDKVLSCCFSGHRSIPAKNLSKLQFLLFQETERLIQIGVNHFITGGAVGFDTLAALTVIELRRKYPQIALELALPCKDQCRKWPKEDILQYQKILGLANKVIFLAEHYYRGCMQNRNRYMVDNSNYCICYCIQNTGGTAYTARYAGRQNKTVINLGGQLS